jgi:hypothetical protein
MTHVKERPQSRTLAWREEIRYLSVRREEPATEIAERMEVQDVGAPGGPLVPRAWIRALSR